MPKGFSEREKSILRQRLLDQGRECFATLGVRKTSVEDLTRATGISKGAFYIFFDSKEELFMEVVEQFEEQYRRQVFEEALNPALPPSQAVRRVLQQAMTEWRQNPLFNRMTREDYEYLLLKLPPEKVQAHLQSDDVFVAQLLDNWQRQGIPVRHDAGLISGLIKALFYVTLHETEFDPDAYPRVIDALIHQISSYIVAE